MSNTATVKENDGTMDMEEYCLTQEKLKLIIPLILEMRVGAFVRTMERAAALGPFLDPTAFIAKGDDLQIDIRMARALLKLHEELSKIYPATATFLAIHRDLESRG